MGKQDRWQPRLTFSPPYEDDEGWKVKISVDARRGDKVPQAEIDFALDGAVVSGKQNVPLPESGNLVTEVLLPGQGVYFLQVNIHDTEDDLWWRSQPQQVRVSVPKVAPPTLVIVPVSKVEQDGEWKARYKVVDTKKRSSLMGITLCLESPYDGLLTESSKKNKETVLFTLHLPRGVTRYKFVVRHSESGTEFIDWIFRTT